MGPLLVIPALIITLLWYMPGIKLQGENAVLKKKDYWWCVWTPGVLTSCLLIVLTEILWDMLVKQTGLSGLPLELIGSFFRAALLEEGFKYMGSKMCVDKYKPRRKIDFVMLFGLIGLTYNVFEKLFLGGVACIVGSLIPMHLMWQFNQGAHYYEHEKAVLAGDEEKAKKEKIGYLLVPFIFHGFWDALISVGAFLMDDDFPGVVQGLGFVLILAVIVVGVKYSIKTFKKVKKLAVENESLPEEVTSENPATENAASEGDSEE